MISLLKQFFDIFKGKKISSDIPYMPKSHQEDTRDQATRKRVKEAFKQQESTMNSRALKSHSASCKDPLTCMKNKCFKWSSDKITSKPYQLDAEKELQDRKKRQKIKRIE